MTSEDENTVMQWAGGQDTTLTLIAALDEHPSAEPLSRFCRGFEKLAPVVNIRHGADDPITTPALIIGRHRNIAYQAVPMGKELSPFLEALTESAGNTPRLKKQLADDLTRLALPLDLKLYITAQCPHCPGMVRRLLPLADASEKIRIRVIDAALFSTQSRNDRIRSVPTLILDDQFRWSGSVNTEEVLTVSLKRDPSKLSAASLRQMLESGEAPQVARMMVETGQVFPALLELLIHERWSVRLGAMVTVEYLTDTATELSEQLVEMLWQRFDGLTDQVQGDVAHVLGQIGSTGAVARLHDILGGPYPEVVRETAAEALADMNE